MAHDENYDYTAGDSIPEEALNAENFVIGGSGAIDHDAAKVEAENSFHDLEPGNYLLKVTGFGKVELKSKTTWINGQAVQYNAPQVEVRFADANDPSGRIRAFFLLPPDDPTFLKYYNQGGNEKGSPQSVGFFAKQFSQFINDLFPGEAFDVVNGRTVLSAKVKQLSNWKGRMVWAQVEMGRENPNAINPTTGEPYPVRTQIKMYSYRTYVAGEPCPLDAPKKAAGRAHAGGQDAGAKMRAAIARDHLVTNGAAVAAAAGLDDI